MTLVYIGPRLSTGEPERSLIYDGIPAGDIDETTLTEAQIEFALASGLYERGKAPKQGKEE